MGTFKASDVLNHSLSFVRIHIATNLPMRTVDLVDLENELMMIKAIVDVGESRTMADLAAALEDKRRLRAAIRESANVVPFWPVTPLPHKPGEIG